MKYLSSIILLVVIFPSVYAQDAPQTADAAVVMPPPNSFVTDTDLAIYAAILNNLRSKGEVGRPVFAEGTSTFSCAESCNGFIVGGCSGMRMADESIQERLAWIDEELGGIRGDTLQSLRENNRSCARIPNKVPTKVKYAILYSEQTRAPESVPKLGEEWDELLYLSRAGISENGNQAVVFAGAASWRDSKFSQFGYYLLKKVSGDWVVENRVIFMKMSPE